jgi:hypothetical protein
LKIITFLREGLDSPNQLEAAGENRFFAHAFPLLERNGGRPLQPKTQLICARRANQFGP